MRRVLGMDPGSKTIDLCVVCDGQVCEEYSIETSRASRDPGEVVELLRGLGDLDLVAAPSGYGVEVTRLGDIPEEVFLDWYYTFILLTSREEISGLASRGVVGAYIYDAMAKIAVEMRRTHPGSILIPGVINMPTVPVYKKINKVDMGTADKLAVAVLGIHQVSEEEGIGYERVDYIHVEMGFGYNAVIAVRGGRVVDGVGGTTMPGPAYLTTGSIDLELAQALERLDKSDVFMSGCIDATGGLSLEDWLERYGSDERATVCLDSMIDSVAKTIYSMTREVPRPRVVLVSGRVGRDPRVFKRIEEEVGALAPVSLMKRLPGAKISKETAQGYAVVAEGVAGGFFRDLVRHTRILDAVGSSLDYILYHRFFETRLGRRFLELRRFMRSEPYNLRIMGLSKKASHRESL